MITTRFLTADEYHTYGDWLKSLDQDTINTYFGVAMRDTQIDNLVSGICADPQHHDFLVAESNGERLGVLHIAQTGANNEVEFGISIAKKHRGKKLGSRLIEEALLWARNRDYEHLYMHCLSWNQPIRHLCRKYGLSMTSEDGETEVKMELPPSTFTSLYQEAATRQRQVWLMMLEKVNPLMQTI